MSQRQNHRLEDHFTSKSHPSLFIPDLEAVNGNLNIDLGRKIKTGSHFGILPSVYALLKP